MKNKIIICLFLILAIGCNKTQTPDPDPIITDPDYKVKTYLRSEYMDVYYYWYRNVKSRNAKLDPTEYSVEDFFDAMLYDKDRWSWMCDGDYYRSMQTGVYTGTWGVSYGQAIDYYDDYAIYIRYIYPGAPFEQYGVTRGARLDAIGGYDMKPPMTQEKINRYYEETAKVETSYTFHLTDGSDVTFTAARAQSLSTRSMLGYSVFGPDDHPGLKSNVGYFNYLTFKKNMTDDIAEAMRYFKENGVKDLILDLRYNGGGDIAACSSLVSYIVPKSYQGKPYLQIVHNDLLSQYNSTVQVPENEEALEIDNVYVITSDETASCSEIVINTLIPFIGDKVHRVGGTTYGKPNGMYVLYYPGSESDYAKYNKGDISGVQWAFLPIAMYDMNSKGDQIPDEGFDPELYWPDDVFSQFGPQEGCVKACLEHIATGSYPVLPAATKSSSRLPGASLTMPQDQPDYGWSIHEMPEMMRKETILSQ